MERAETLHGLPLPTAKDREALPHFLVISPPKTGSTWLAANLNCHPEIFIPDIKEVDFFNHYVHSKGWDWYTDMFRPGLGLTRGEATPNYCLMPAANVQLVHSLMPGLKLIYIIREPVGRAWSHARHCFRHRQTTFEGYSDSIDKVPDEKWIENVSHHTNLYAGRIVEHLKSWLAFFPPEQIYIDFYPSIRTDPRGLLSRIFKFLGVSAINDFSFFQIAQKLNEGISRRMTPVVEQFLHALYAPSTAEVAAILREKFALTLPEEWRPLLQPNAERSEHPAPAVSVTSLPARQSTPTTTPPLAPSVALPCRSHSFERRRLKAKYTPKLRDMNYFGYQLIYYKGQFFAVAHDAGLIDFPNMTEKEITRLEGKGLMFRSPSLEWVKLQVTDKQLAPLYRPPRKPSLTFRAQRYVFRRLGALVSGVAARIQVLSPRAAARLKPTPMESRQSA